MSNTSSTVPASQAQTVAIAILLRPQGRRGELLAEPLTDLDEVFAHGRTVQLQSSTPKTPLLTSRVLEDCWRPTGRNAGRLVLKLSDCNSINDAEALAGCQLLIPAAEMPVLDHDTFFVGDLIGCAFFDGTRQVGSIIDIEFPVGSDGRRLDDAAPLLAVQLDSADEPVLVPFIRAWLDQVDLDARRVTMHLPEGLLVGGELVGEAEADELDGESPDAV